MEVCHIIYFACIRIHILYNSQIGLFVRSLYWDQSAGILNMAIDFIFSEL